MHPIGRGVLAINLMNLLKPAIVIPAYSRPQSLARLLKSIDAADYPEAVKLFISLEGGASDDVKRVAYAFSSPRLQVEIIQRRERLGLRNHILACGDLAVEFGSIIVLEDDLLVDRYFYHYAVAALTHYSTEESIAGIALYAPEYNDYAGLPFKPMNNGFSTYPIQTPCSWGQCWTATQWRQFRHWYVDANVDTVNDIVGLPSEIKSWPESSWKKYFAAYLIQENRQFIYPYQAYATNCADPGGTHVSSGSTIYQVSFASQFRPLPKFLFCPLSNSEVAYDAFMEPCGRTVYRQLGLDRSDVEIDTLGVKPFELLRQKEFALTCRPALNAISQYPGNYRPVEHNLFHQVSAPAVEDNTLRLTRPADIINKRSHKRTLKAYSYFSGLNLESWSISKQVLKLLPTLVFARIMRRFKK